MALLFKGIMRMLITINKIPRRLEYFRVKKIVQSVPADEFDQI